MVLQVPFGSTTRWSAAGCGLNQVSGPWPRASGLADRCGHRGRGGHPSYQATAVLLSRYAGASACPPSPGTGRKGQWSLTTSGGTLEVKGGDLESGGSDPLRPE